MAFQNPFRTLRYRDFRLLWSGEVLRTSSQWMDQITRGFLVWDLTHSASHLALVTAVRAAPLLVIGVIAGVLADRISRKTLLLASQGINIGAHLAIAVLFALGWVELWHVYLTAVFVGFGMAINAPARQSMLPSLVPPKDLQSAVVLNTATLNIGQSLGPAIGGVALATIGISWSFVLQAFMVLMASVLIRRMVVPERTTAPAEESWWSSAADGFRYLIRNRLLLALFLSTLVPMILVQPFRGVVPSITVEQLMADEAATGFLMSVLGIGALVSVLYLASVSTVRNPWRKVVVHAGLFSLSIAVFSISPSFVVSAVALFLAGYTQASNRTLTQSVLLAETEDSYRGRISSLWVVNRGTLPLGSVILAGVTLWWGVGVAMAALSVLSAVLTVFVAVWARELWRNRE